MPCNRKIKPVMTPEQIAECMHCKHISGKKIWCCLFGFYVKPPQNRIITPRKRIIQPPTIPQMATHFSKAMVRWAKKGFKTVSKEVYMQRRLACAACQPKGRCPHCGCSLWAKAALITEQCPEDKWEKVNV